MKTLKNCFGTRSWQFCAIVLALMLGLTFAACDHPGSTSEDRGGHSGDDSTSDSVFLGKTLKFSGQVYLEKWNNSKTINSYETFNGNLDTFDYCGGEGEIRNGKLAHVTGTPDHLIALDLEDLLGEGYEKNYDYVQSSNQNVQSAILYCVFADSGEYFGLFKENHDYRETSTSITETYAFVKYVYVDAGVTVSGKGKTNSTTAYVEGNWVNHKWTTQDFNLELKAGWNTVYTKSGMSLKATEISFIFDLTETQTISLYNPSSLKWALLGMDDYSGSSGSLSSRRATSSMGAIEKSGLRKFGRIPQKTPAPSR